MAEGRKRKPDKPAPGDDAEKPRKFSRVEEAEEELLQAYKEQAEDEYKVFEAEEAERDRVALAIRAAGRPRDDPLTPTRSIDPLHELADNQSPVAEDNRPRAAAFMEAPPSTAYRWPLPIAMPQNEPIARSLTSMFVRVNDTGRMFLCAICLNYVMFEGLLKDRWREIFGHNLRNHRAEYLRDCGLDRVECDVHQEGGQEVHHYRMLGYLETLYNSELTSQWRRNICLETLEGLFPLIGDFTYDRDKNGSGAFMRCNPCSFLRIWPRSDSGRFHIEGHEPTDRHQRCPSCLTANPDYNPFVPWVIVRDPVVITLDDTTEEKPEEAGSDEAEHGSDPDHHATDSSGEEPESEGEAGPSADAAEPEQGGALAVTDGRDVVTAELQNNGAAANAGIATVLTVRLRAGKVPTKADSSDSPSSKTKVSKTPAKLESSTGAVAKAPAAKGKVGRQRGANKAAAARSEADTRSVNGAGPSSAGGPHASGGRHHGPEAMSLVAQRQRELDDTIKASLLEADAEKTAAKTKHDTTDRADEESPERILRDYWKNKHPGERFPANFRAFISEAAAESPRRPTSYQTGARGDRALANTSVGASMPIVSEVVGAGQLFALPVPPIPRVCVLNNKKKSNTTAGNENTGGRQPVPRPRSDPRTAREAGDRNPNPANGRRRGAKAKAPGRPNVRNDSSVPKETPPPAVCPPVFGSQGSYMPVAEEVPEPAPQQPGLAPEQEADRSAELADFHVWAALHGLDGMSADSPQELEVAEAPEDLGQLAIENAVAEPQADFDITPAPDNIEIDNSISRELVVTSSSAREAVNKNVGGN